MPSRRLGGLVALAVTSVLLGSSHTTALPGTPIVSSFDVDIGGGDVSWVEHMAADGSSIIVFATSGPPRYVVDLDDGAEQAAATDRRSRLNANGTFLYETPSTSTVLRTERSTGATLTIEPDLDWGYEIHDRSIMADDSGDLVAFDANSGFIARYSTFVVHAPSGTVLTPGDAGINTSDSINSKLLHVDPGGEFVIYETFLVGGPSTFWRWNRSDGSRLRIDPPADITPPFFPAQVSPGFEAYAYVDTEGDLTVVDRATGTTAVLPDSTAGIRAFEVLDDGTLVYAKEQRTRLREDAPLLYGWTPGANAPTPLSMTSEGAVPDFGVDWFEVSTDGETIVFTAFGDDFVTGETGEVRRIYVVRFDESIPSPAPGTDISGAATARAPAVRLAD